MNRHQATTILTCQYAIIYARFWVLIDTLRHVIMNNNVTLLKCAYEGKYWLQIIKEFNMQGIFKNAKT